MTNYLSAYQQWLYCCTNRFYDLLIPEMEHVNGHLRARGCAKAASFTGSRDVFRPIPFSFDLLKFDCIKSTDFSTKTASNASFRIHLGYKGRNLNGIFCKYSSRTACSCHGLGDTLLYRFWIMGQPA